MATYRCGVFLIAGLLLAGQGAVFAQQSSSGALTYDQMRAQEQQAQAQAAKHGKKEAPAAEAPAQTESATPPAAAAEPATDAATATTPAETTPAETTAPAAAPTVPASAAVATVPAKTVKDDPNQFKPVKLKDLEEKQEKHERGKHGPKVKKEKAPKLVPVDIVHGKLTVDGLIAKAGLNFQILDLKYLYIWVPGLGTAIISNEPFAGANLQGGALDGNTLSVTVDGHNLQLSCDEPLLVTKNDRKQEDKEERSEAKAKPVKAAKRDKKDKPVAMYVAIDRNWQKPSSYPEFGYGDLLKAPYSWPGTLADLNSTTKAPPLPDNLKQHPEIVKFCGKNGDPNSCREVSVPLVLGKQS